MKNQETLTALAGVCPALAKLAQCAIDLDPARDVRALLMRLRHTASAAPDVLLRRHRRFLQLCEDLRATYSGETLAVLAELFDCLRLDIATPKGFRYYVDSAARACAIANICRYAGVMGEGFNDRHAWKRCAVLILSALEDLAPPDEPLHVVKVPVFRPHVFVTMSGAESKFPSRLVDLKRLRRFERQKRVYTMNFEEALTKFVQSRCNDV